MPGDSAMTRPYPEVGAQDDGRRACRETVLLCGRDAPLLPNMATIIKEVGIGVSCCQGSSQLMEMAAAREDRPRLIVIEMEDRSCGQPVNLLMLRELFPVGVIAVGASSDDESMARALNAGADYYMVKPFGKAEFLARVRALLRRK